MSYNRVNNTAYGLGPADIAALEKIFGKAHNQPAERSYTLESLAETRTVYAPELATFDFRLKEKPMDNTPLAFKGAVTIDLGVTYLDRQIVSDRFITSIFPGQNVEVLANDHFQGTLNIKGKSGFWYKQGFARFQGGAGDDRIEAVGGANVITGGGGSDRFVFTPNSGTGNVITDFSLAGDDMLVIASGFTSIELLAVRDYGKNHEAGTYVTMRKDRNSDPVTVFVKDIKPEELKRQTAIGETEGKMPSITVIDHQKALDEAIRRREEAVRKYQQAYAALPDFDRKTTEVKAAQSDLASIRITGHGHIEDRAKSKKDADYIDVEIPGRLLGRKQAVVKMRLFGKMDNIQLDMGGKEETLASAGFRVTSYEIGGKEYGTDTLPAFNIVNTGQGLKLSDIRMPREEDVRKAREARAWLDSYGKDYQLFRDAYSFIPDNELKKTYDLRKKDYETALKFLEARDSQNFADLFKDAAAIVSGKAESMRVDKLSRNDALEFSPLEQLPAFRQAAAMLAHFTVTGEETPETRVATGLPAHLRNDGKTPMV